MHGRPQKQEETRAAVIGYCKEDWTKTEAFGQVEEQLSRIRSGWGVCMHGHIDSICVPAQKVGSNGEMSRWRQARVGRQARQWLADGSVEFQQISSESLPTTGHPVTASDPAGTWLPKLPGPKPGLLPTARAGREKQANSTAAWVPYLRAMRKGQ